MTAPLAARRLLALRYWPAWFGVAVLRLLTLLPWPWRRRLGAGLGRLLQRTLGSRVRVARRNLSLCFPDRSEAERELLLDATFSSLGMLVFEAGFAWWGSATQHRPRYTVHGLHHLEAARDAGQGVLLLFGHFTTLELAGRLLSYHWPMAVLYREHGDPVLEWVVRRYRGGYADALFNRNELRPMVRYLRGGGVLWYAPDQDYERGQRVFTPFFGIETATTTSAHELARMGRARVLTIRHCRDAAGHYHIRIQDPLPELPGPDPAEDCRRINAEIEAMVRACPGQYLWVHRRFKNRPPGAPSLYD